MCLCPIEVAHPETGLLSSVRCGQCRQCRLRRKRSWVGRLRLENQMHEASRFLTLTYAQDPGILNPDDLRDFLKRYRYHYGKCRFFAVGEYGDRNGRGHWHLIIFGHPPGNSMKWTNNLAWDRGFSYDGTVTKASIAYVAGYVLKSGDDKQHRALVRLSLKPGIGFGRIEQMALAAPKNLPVWPTSYRVGGVAYPLCDGGLAKFQTVYLENGGLPPYNANPIARDLHVRASYVLEAGTRFENKTRSLLQHRRNGDEFAAKTRSKKLES